MIRSRIIVGLAVLLASATPLYLLSRITYGMRYGILTGIYEEADMVFPDLAGMLWPFGPLDWWGYIAPVALAVGIAARIRSAHSLPFLSALFGFSVIQSIVTVGAFEPFANIGDVMGYPESAPYPTLPLIVNLAMLFGALLFALISIKRNLRTGPPGNGNTQELPQPPSRPKSA